MLSIISEQSAKNNFLPVTQNNTQSIDLAKMFAPGYLLNESATAVAVPDSFSLEPHLSYLYHIEFWQYYSM